jgi:secondary thiamine-phosphate synthase enzyme
VAWYGETMRQHQTSIDIATRGAGLIEITDPLERFVREAGIETGIVTAFCRHTSCSLLLQENADPDVRRDLNEFFSRIAPEGMDWIVHRTEGPDDMPAHIKSALTQSSISIPVAGGVALLGTWQGLYLFEHRTRPHRRTVVLHVIGE